VIETFVRGLSNGGLLKINDSHVGFVPILATHGGTGRTGGPTGELNYAILRTTHQQGISRTRGSTGDVLELPSIGGAETTRVPA
jgi:hypothetical protein